MKFPFLTALIIFISLGHFSFSRSKGSGGIARSTHAVIISIGSYPEQPSWPSVDSKKDIENIEYFIKKFSPRAGITSLRNELATKKAIIDAFDLLYKNAKAGDQVYLHFSGGGFQLKTDTVKQVFMPFDAPSVEDVTDAVMNNKTPDLTRVITDEELIGNVQRIRKKIGVSGQFFFTMDASRFGPKNSSPQSILGRGGFLRITDSEAGLSPFIMMTSCLDKEESYFIGEKEPFVRSFSMALKKYCEGLKTGEQIKYNSLFNGLKQQMQMIAPKQTLAIAGPFADMIVFNESVNGTQLPAENEISKDSRLFILSIGISTYNGKYAFANCDDDAVLFNDIMRLNWRRGDTTGIRTWLLLNKNATREAILKAINEIIADAKDEDVFAFFFAGFTNEPKNKDGSYLETWFYPQIGQTVDIASREGINEKEILTLKELKKLFDYLKCDKQLLFTEAGWTKNFKREFVRSMIKTNPVITEIRKRNRVIIVPDKEGFDAVACDDKMVSHGPGLYFFSQLGNNTNDRSVNIFDLFSEDESKRSNVVFRYRNEQFKCRYGNQYISFFFEKEFVEDLQYYFTKDVNTNQMKRGAGEDEADIKMAAPVAGKKYALVIGTNTFATWDSLHNPMNDAISIADTLRELFGYTTQYLPNPSLKKIYNSLFTYRSLLKENDQFVLYIAGHGYYDSTIFKDGFIVASDSKALKADTFLTSYIPFSQLRNITDNFNAKQVMVLLDVCFSGAFDDSEESLGGNINYNLTGRLTDGSVGKKLQMITRKYITAGSKTEKVGDDYNGQHSPFAYFLLEGLRRAAKEKKYLSSGMLFKFIQAYLEDTIPLQAGFGKDQQRSGSEFIFIAK
jgi:uncharacterized caspase-like protein